jgi:hypothetical protein
MNAQARRMYAERQWPRPQWPPLLVSASELSPAVSEPVGYQRAEVSAPSTETEPNWVAPTMARLSELAALERNWDRRHSAEVSRDALVFAIVVLSQVMSETTVPPSIVPLGRGSLQLLWHNDAAELEVEVLRPNEIVAYFLDKKIGHEEEIPLTSDFSAVTRFLSAHF